jgi:hypothetical protein
LLLRAEPPRLLLLPAFDREGVERDGGTLREFADSIDGFGDPFRSRSGCALTLPFSVDLPPLVLPLGLEPAVGLLYVDLLEDESFSRSVNCLPLADVGDGFILTAPLLPFDLFPVD